MRSMNRRVMMATSSVFALLGHAARAQAPAPAAAATPKAADTDWTQFGGDLASTRYSSLDQIDASNFNKLELAWKFSTDALGPTPDAYFNSTPLIVKGRIFTTAGMRRDVVALDGATGELLWSYRHDEGARLGTPSIPPGKVKFDETFNKNVETYHGSVAAITTTSKATRNRRDLRNGMLIASRAGPAA